MAPCVEAAAEWGTDREGMGLRFDVYEIDSYAAGARDFIVPCSAFD